MSANQPQPAPKLASHPCAKTSAMPPFATVPPSQYAEYFSSPAPSSSSASLLPSSIFLPPPTQPPSTATFAPPAHLLPSPTAQYPPQPHSMSSFAPPGPHTSHYTSSSADHPASFSLSLHSPHHPALVKLTATSYLPLRAWLPWLEWDGSWVESHPMQTVARCPVGRVSETVQILQEKGVRQTRHMLLAKF